MIVGIDVGGTFTDFVLLDDSGEVTIHKLLTTTLDPSLAILRGLAELGAASGAAVVHGATVATNAILERRGARTALVTTLGFGDVLEIGRQARPDLYALHPTRPAPLVPAEHRYELHERIAPPRQSRRGGTKQGGIILVPLDIPSTDAVVHEILSHQVESVAVCLLFSFLHPDHEQQVRDRIASIGGKTAPLVSLSSEVLPEFREYERTVATVLNAYVAPIVSRYLSNLEQGLGSRRLRIMQSNGGSISAEAARVLPARTALSGPAGGVVGAFDLACRGGFDQIITFDMGGTSTDVSLCPGHVQETTEGAIGGLPFRLPTIDIHTVGAGGGSIAGLDAGGALHVGPQSAGAEPGPVCYGRPEATGITVSDANLLLGRLDADHFLGGKMQLDVRRCRERMQELARTLSLPLEAAAWGILRVANSNMERAIRTISVERGYDPRDFTLVAFGGAGPLHACELAGALRIPRVLIPPSPGVLSAMGMILADLVKDYSQTVMLPADDVDADTLARLLDPLCHHAYLDMCADGLADQDIALSPALDMRYIGQSFELSVPVEYQLAGAEGQQAGDAVTAPTASRCLQPLDVLRTVQAFHSAHRHRFSYSSEGEPIEIVNVRLKAIGRTPKPRFSRHLSAGVNPKAAHIGYKQVHFADTQASHAPRPYLAALYERERLDSGNTLVGPAVIFQMDSTVVLPPGWAATVDAWGNLVAEWREG